MAASSGTASASASTKTESQPPNPLVWAYPSPYMLLHYPLFATNVRILCEKDGWKAPSGQSSLVTTIASLRLTYRTEGLRGLYRGGHLYLLHQSSREAFRFCACRLVDRYTAAERAEKALALLDKERSPNKDAKEITERVTNAERALAAKNAERWFYWTKMLVKYAIDVVCYPILLASTRGIVATGEPRATLQRLRLWSQAEGALSLFNGLSCSLVSTALDEAMEIGLAACIDRFSTGSELELADKVLLKASALSVASIFTSPFNYIGVIQRCQSSLPGLLAFSPIWQTAKSLPWRGSFYQFVLFASIFALNVKMVQWKLEMQADDDEDDGTE